MKPQIPDVLAQRYASSAMCAIWSAEGKIISERQFWIAVMKAQRELGISIPEYAIEAYESVVEEIHLDRIEEREKSLRHDVKSRIEEFCHLAGYEHIHKGMTSRDLTDNVEQLQIKKSLELVRLKVIAVLEQLATVADTQKDQIMVARTHNVPAQPSTVGKRLAMFGEEILQTLESLEQLAQNYPLRGLQGAIGTRLDQLTLLGNKSSLQDLDQSILKHLSFDRQLNAVGQVYPRGLDHQVTSTLYAVSSGITSLAKTLRLMAGQDLMTEGFQKGQVGSSAMPHKMNTRSLERICGFHSILNGYSNMTMALAGDQWNEGDVSCSVVRRVALPGCFYAIDGQLETLSTVLQEMGFYDAMIQKELEHYLPFLATTTVLMEAVKQGAGRESAHEAIKEHAVASAKELRFEGQSENPLIPRLAEDPRIPLNLEELQHLLSNAQHLTACAEEQVLRFCKSVQLWKTRYPESQSYQAEAII